MFKKLIKLITPKPKFKNVWDLGIYASNQIEKEMANILKRKGIVTKEEAEAIGKEVEKLYPKLKVELTLGPDVFTAHHHIKVIGTGQSWDVFNPIEIPKVKK